MGQQVFLMDSGDGITRADNGCFARGPFAKTANFTIANMDTGKMFTNRGASGNIIATLPAAKKGNYFAFGRPTAHTLTLTATGGAKIDGGSANGTSAIATAGITILASDGTDWYTLKAAAAGPLTIPQGSDGELIIGQTGGDSVYTALTGDVTLSAAGVTAIGAGKVTAAMHAHGTNGQILIGVTGSPMALAALSGDVTMTSAGVTSIGAGKVTAAMQAHLTDGQILIGATSASMAAAVLSGDVTMSKLGVVTLADGLVHTASVTITNAQLKALRATPITIVSAPGANKILSFVSGTLVLKAGSNVLTESGCNLGFRYTNGSGVQVCNAIECTGFIDQAVDTATSAVPLIDAVVAVSAGANKALVLHNLGGSEFAGNAANNATLIVSVAYRIVATA